MNSLPQEMLDYIIDFIQFDHQTLKNIREASQLFHHSTDFIHNVVEEYTSIFNQPLADEKNNLLINDMLDHLKYLEDNNISIEKAKEIDTFIKEHDDDIDFYVRCQFARGKCTILMNNIRDYDIFKYLLFLGANPNQTTSREGYTMATFVEKYYDEDIDQKANMYVLLIKYGMDIHLSDGDSGESLNSYLTQDPVLLQKVLDKLGIA